MDKNPVHSALKRQIPNFLSVGVFSAFINLLMLTGSIYMLQIYDRVLSSRSVETLVALTLLAIAAFCLQGALDGFRVRILSRIGALIDDALSPLAFRAATLLPLRGASPAEAMQPVSDTDTLRAFLGGAGPTALFDMPFTPIFMAGCFLLHPWLGWFALVGGILLIALTFVTEQRTGEPSKSASASATRRGVYADAARRHAEVVDVLGMRSAVVKRWIGISESFRSNVLALSDIQSGLGAIARMVRVMLQSAVLGLGAYLAIQHEVSGGAMIAASILTSRALAPIETAIEHWKGFTG
ncbi:MAG: ABC transporter transmembrane domain-containing protein, partial [Alphaproteobacteria bacterium]